MRFKPFAKWSILLIFMLTISFSFSQTRITNIDEGLTMRPYFSTFKNKLYLWDHSNIYKITVDNAIQINDAPVLSSFFYTKPDSIQADPNTNRKDYIIYMMEDGELYSFDGEKHEFFLSYINNPLIPDTLSLNPIILIDQKLIFKNTNRRELYVYDLFSNTFSFLDIYIYIDGIRFLSRNGQLYFNHPDGLLKTDGSVIDTITKSENENIRRELYIRDEFLIDIADDRIGIIEANDNYINVIDVDLPGWNGPQAQFGSGEEHVLITYGAKCFHYNDSSIYEFEIEDEWYSISNMANGQFLLHTQYAEDPSLHIYNTNSKNYQKIILDDFIQNEVNTVKKFIYYDDQYYIFFSRDTPENDIVWIYKLDIDNLTLELLEEFPTERRLYFADYIELEDYAIVSCGSNHIEIRPNDDFKIVTSYEGSNYSPHFYPIDSSIYFYAYDPIFNKQLYVYGDFSGCLTSFDEVIDQSTIKLYPNPVSDKLNLEQTNLGVIKYVIHSVTGIKIKEGSMQSMLDVSSLRKGVYIISLFKDNDMTSHMFIKE